ncbi:MAG: acyl-CoA dehydrogenase family protein [Desulfobacterales bacterium]
MLNFDLTPEQLELRDKARAFALSEVLPAAWHYDEKDQVPVFLLKKAFDAGLMNNDIPKAYGGKGYGILEGALMTEEIAAACPGVATSVFDNSLGMEPLILSKNEALKEKYLSQIAADFKLICFATSEPGMGSDVAGIRCKAEPDGEDYILNGTKYWITNGGIADYMTVFATVDPESQHRGICAFLVERDWEGVSVGRHIPKMGQRCSNTTGLNFKNVRVPKANVIAPPGEGFVMAMKTFSRTRPVIGAFAVGAARSAMEYAIDYAKKRRTFGSRIAEYQAIQFKIAEMYQKVETSRLLVWKSAWEADCGKDPIVSASIAKFYSTEVALEVVNEALQILGGYGYTKMFPLEKLLRDIRLLRIYEGTSEIQRMVVSGHALGAYEPVMPSLEDLPMMWDKDLGDRTDDTQEQQPAWRCRICGHMHYGAEAPEECPYCFYPKTTFKQVWP